MQRSTPHSPIASRDNSFVKLVRSLADARRRKKERAFIIEGVKAVEDALRDKAGVKAVVAAPALTRHHGKGVLKLAEDRGVEVVWISDSLMDSLAESRTPQPVMALVTMKEYGEDVLFSNPSGLIVVAHELQDPGNLGTIIRTAEAAGASGAAVTPNTVDPYNSKAVRASMGSLLRLPTVQVGDLKTFLATCGQKGWQTAAAAPTGAITHFDADFTKPTVILLGREGAGLPPDVMDCIDVSLRIPMANTIDSLNVAVAAAVILYEALRQRFLK
jgi:RNA methyltransferase, TrmH family